VDEIRQLSIRIETLHAVTYFADESRDAARDAGLRGFWMGYFGFRAAPLAAAAGDGTVGADVVTDAFYNFAPAMVERAIPDAWTFASPADLLAARASSAAAALRRLAPGDIDAARAAAPLLAAAATAATDERRPLYAANRALDIPDDPVAALWQVCTTMREQRGDAHVNALRDAGVSGLDAHLLLAADDGIPDEVLRNSRGWSEAEWEHARASLIGRGLLDDSGEAATISAAGREVRAEVERATDRAAFECWRELGTDAMATVAAALQGAAATIARSGLIPFPNPMGLPSAAR